MDDIMNIERNIVIITDDLKSKLKKKVKKKGKN